MDRIPVRMVSMEAGDRVVLRCRVGVVVDPWRTIVVVPGHPFLLTIRIPDDACLDKHHGNVRPIPEVGDHLVLRCRVDEVVEPGHLIIEVPGHGAIIHIGVDEDVDIEKAVRRGGGVDRLA